MSKKIVILLALLLMLSLILGFINKTTTFPDRETIIYPWSYIIDVFLEKTDDDSIITIPFVMAKNYPNSKNTDLKLIIESKIVLPNEIAYTNEDGEDVFLSFSVDLKEVEKIGKTKFNSKDLYLYNLIVNIPATTNYIFEDAYLELTFITGIKEQIYIGDLVFFNIQSLFYEMDHAIQKTRALAVINDLWEITGLIIEFNVKENVILESFDFRLPKYGIDREKVVILNEPLDRLEKLYTKKELDKEFPEIYQLDAVKQTTKTINRELTTGVNTVVIPFTKSTANYVPKIKVLGGIFTYTKGEEQLMYPLESLEYFFVSPFEFIEEMVRSDWK